MSKMDTAEVHSIRMAAGYSMMDHKHNGIREMEITNINYTILSKVA
jgi:hypothetical protein